MSISDSSQLSDESGISRIRSSGIRPSKKIDSVFNGPEIHDSVSIRGTTSKPVAIGLRVDCTTNANEVAKALAHCQNAIHNCARLELIHESVREISTTHSQILQHDAVTKLKNILVAHEVNKYLQLPNTDTKIHEDLTLLGITELPKIKFSHDEKRDINAAVENRLREKINEFIVSYEMLGGSVKDASKNHDATLKTCLAGSQAISSMRWKDQTDEICDEYYRSLLQCADLMYQWHRLKHVDMSELNLKNSENLLLEAQVAEVQAKITTKTCTLKMFKETLCTVDAFRILNENLDAKITKTREQLREKKTLRTTYEDVFTSDYDEILNKYTELVNVIKKKERLLEML